MEKRNDKRLREQLEAQMLKEIKNLVNENKYSAALDKVAQIEVGKIKVAPNLCLIGEVYMHEKMYDDAEKLFLKAYDKSPNSRRILNLLTSLYIEKGEYSEAEYYYKEFIDVAPRDLHRYILRYCIDRAKGERISVLIDTLERLKTYEYIEDWAYELAELYHKSGDDKKAIHECDEIILWFGNGKFVNRAITLKCLITGETVPEFEDDDIECINEIEDVVETNTEDNTSDSKTYHHEDEIEHVSGLTDTSIDIALIEKALEEQAGKLHYENADEDNHKPVVNDTGMVSKAAAKQFFDTLTSIDTTEFWESEDEDDEFVDELIEEDDDESFDIESIKDDKFKESLFGGDFTEDDFDEDDFTEEDFVEDDFEEEDFVEDDFAEDGFTEDNFKEDDFKKDTGNISTDEIIVDFNFEDESEEEDDFVEEDFEDNSDDIMSDESWTQDDKNFIDELFSEKKTSSNIFATIPDITYVKEQLSKTFTKFEDAELKGMDILADYDINFVVLSNDTSMKAEISLGIVKALNTYGMCDKDKIVRASAEELNRRDFKFIFERINGGCLIIDEACKLSDDSAKIIEEYVNKENQQTAIVFSSTENDIMDFWKKHQNLRAKFLNVIHVSNYNEMELVTLAKGYAEGKKYELDEAAALILRDYFHKELQSQREVTYDDVIAIVNMAISNLEKRNVKNLFMTVLDNKYEEARMFRLLAEDFRILGF